MTGSRIIKKRARIFLGCEGESEQAYSAFLQRLAEDEGLMVHLRSVNLQPAGDPLALAEKAVLAYDREVNRGGFVGKIILLDADRLEEPLDRGLRARRLLEDEGFTTILQQPDHEGLLLRHFDGHNRDDPPRGTSMAALHAVWPGYRKNMAASDLKRSLSLRDVQRAAIVIPELQALLRVIGFN